MTQISPLSPPPRRPLLILDCNRDPSSFGAREIIQALREAQAGEAQENGWITVRRAAPPQDLPSFFAPPGGADEALCRFRGVIISGSRTSAFEKQPWIEALLAWIRQAVSLKLPLLGICFGHQMLARALAPDEPDAGLGLCAQPRLGWCAVEHAAVSSLLRGVANPFLSFSSHAEELKHLPAGFRLLARTRHSHEIQAIQWQNQPVFGVQFHPEKDASAARRALSSQQPFFNSQLAASQNEAAPVFWPPGIESKQQALAKQLFGNFLEICHP